MTPRFASYEDALRYLDSFISYEKTPPPKYCGETHYNLARFRSLLASVGRPELGLPCVHIAGTDGKGSTAVFLATLLQASGYRVGLYTSPHLFDYTERIQVDGQPVSRDAFTELLTLLAGRLEAVTASSNASLEFFATVFELLTAAAFLHFRAQQVDIAVIETGLGGTLDATNVVQPLLSILTPIHHEHTALLGKTHRQIAGQKAGIIKPGCPVLTSHQTPVALEVIRDACRQQGSALFPITRYLRATHVQPSLSGYEFTLSSPTRWPRVRLRCPIPGRHQVHNLTLALLAAQFILDQRPASPAPPSPQLLATAERCLPALRWPGRSEIYSLSSGVWLLDSAHSPQGAACLRQLLDDLFPGRTVHHLLAFSQDKDIRAFLARLLRPGDHVSCYQSNHPRALAQESLYGNLATSLKDSVLHRSVPLAQLLSAQAASANLFCVSGSLFWVAVVKKAITSLQPCLSKHQQPTLEKGIGCS